MKRQGFVLVLTLMIIAASVALISLSIGRVRAYRVMHRAQGEREKARMLAWGGISLAMGELAQLFEQPHTDEEKRERAHFVIAYLNHWHTYAYKEAVEGIDGECRLYISCEQGKLDLNAFYDFTKKQVKPYKKLYEFLNPVLARCIGSQEYTVEKSLDALYKKQHVPIEEVSILCTVLNEHAYDALFMSDPAKLAISDLFTVANDGLIDPLLFSYSVQQILSITVNTEKIPTEEIVALLTAPRIDWQVSWNKALAPVYGISYEKIPVEIRAFFSSRSRAQTFSVLSYGKVGDTVQKLCVLIEKNNDTTNTVTQQPFIIKRLYWL